jgi:hypothetical protein
MVDVLTNDIRDYLNGLTDEQADRVLERPMYPLFMFEPRPMGCGCLCMTAEGLDYYRRGEPGHPGGQGYEYACLRHTRDVVNVAIREHILELRAKRLLSDVRESVEV